MSPGQTQYDPWTQIFSLSMDSEQTPCHRAWNLASQTAIKKGQVTNWKGRRVNSMGKPFTRWETGAGEMRPSDKFPFPFLSHGCYWSLVFFAAWGEMLEQLKLAVSLLAHEVVAGVAVYHQCVTAHFSLSLLLSDDCISQHSINTLALFQACFPGPWTKTRIIEGFY